MRRELAFALLAGGLGAASCGWSAPLDFAGLFERKVDAIRDTVRDGEWEGYVTGYAWHLPYTYDSAARARLNETAWGGGLGRTREDDDGDRHTVFFKAFSDSHHDPQLNIGYAWQRYWPVTRTIGVGAGYLAFLFMREDVAKYCPLPAVLPCASIRYRNLELVGLFVPRLSEDIKGDVLFVYLRVPLGRGRMMRDAWRR